MSLITILFDVLCYNFVTKVFIAYYCFILKMISSMWPHLKVNKYILFFKKILVSTSFHIVPAY